MDILGKIRRLQEERGWSENHLAEQAHLSQSTINSLYRKGNVPTIPTLEAICRELDCQPGDIIEYRPEETQKQ